MLVGFIFKPYFYRVKLGEGGIVFFNLLFAAYTYRDVKCVILQTIVSFIVMCALYGFNDYHDREKDRDNPKKDNNFTLEIIRHEKLFLLLNFCLTIGTIVFVFFFLSHFKAVIILFLYIINYLYSVKVKGIPILDLIIVVIWGSLFIAISGKFQLSLILIAGVMTGIAHLFQMITDKEVDKHNNITTSIVQMPKGEIVLLTSICLILGILLYSTIGIYWAVSCILPVIVYIISSNVTFSWYLARVYFLICWIALLNLFYGTI